MTVISLNNVSKHFDDTRAVQDVSLEVKGGDLLVLLGASGCGKTTTLRLIAGLEAPNKGEIYLNNSLVAGNGHWVPPEHRHIGMVFQDYALFPHLTVAANVAFPLNHMPNRQRKGRVSEMLALVGLDDYGSRYPHQLSGGQQQRVALARALAPAPTVVLLDEPFSNLDAALRKVMRTEVRRILQATGTTAVFVTHDQEEALSIADQVAVLRAGRLLQTGNPYDVYLRPVNPEVARFVGEANFVKGEADGSAVKTLLGDLPLANDISGAVSVLLRPELLWLSPRPSGVATVVDVQFGGHDQMVIVELPDKTRLLARVRSYESVEVGMKVNITVRDAVMAYTD